jgi:hypothetical protein
MSTITRAVRLAVIVEAVSCVAMLYQENPVSFWNSWTASLGWSPFAVSDALVSLFDVIHFPVLFVLYHLHIDDGSMVYNGRLIPGSWLIIAMLVQFWLWSLVFLGLLHVEKKIRARFRHHDA